MSKKILIIGGAGYIGSHITHQLNDKGYNTVVFDNLSTGFEDNIDSRSGFIHGSIFDHLKLDKALKDIDTVIHLAALKNAGESMEFPGKYAKHNIIGSLDLINLCIKNNIQNFIFSSSAAVYGNPEYLPLDESHPVNPINYYGYTKLCIERNLIWFNKITNLNISCLRYFNAAGYDLRGRIKCKEKNPANLIPIVMEVACGQRKTIQVYGNDYDTLDGTCLRDYIHVNDLASAHELALNYLSKNGNSLIVNLATGKSFSVMDVINKTQKISRKKINYQVIGRRYGDPSKLYSKSIKAEKLLGWKPKHSDLNTIIKSTWEVYK